MSASAGVLRGGLVPMLVMLGLTQAAIASGSGTESAGIAQGDLTRGAPTIGSEIRVSGALALGHDQHPAVAYNPTGDQYLIAWSDERTGGPPKIYGQLMAADGTAIGSNFRIAANGATRSQYRPAIAFDTLTNRYLVVWEDLRNGNYDIYGQLIDADGALIGRNRRLSDPDADHDEVMVSVAFDSVAGRYLVVWQYLTSEGYEPPFLWDIHAQRVKPNGDRAGANFRIGGPGAVGSEQSADVAYDPVTNRFLVVWQDNRDYGTRSLDVYGQRIKPSGATAGNEFRISGPSATGAEQRPVIGHSPVKDAYLVVWADTRNGYQVWGQRIKGGGRLAGGNFAVGELAGPLCINTSIAFDAVTERFTVIWDDERDVYGRGIDIYGRRVKPGGRLVGSDFRISGRKASDDETNPAAAANSAHGEILVVWTDLRAELTRGSDIYARRLNG